MGLLNKNRKLSESELGAMYECLFPEYIVRFTIYNNNTQRIECFFWDNDGYNNRTGQARCLRSFLKDTNVPAKDGKNIFQKISKIGKGYDTFEDTDKAWTDYYNSFKNEQKDVTKKL